MDQAGDGGVWAAIHASALREHSPVSLRHAVMACADLLGATGAGLSMARDGAPREPVLASSPRAEELEELQFTLGEGPCMDAAAGNRPVLVPDLATASARNRWPVFAPAAMDHGVRAAFAFPVTTGTALVGVLDVYRAQPGRLGPRELANALVLADVVLVLALDEQGGITAEFDDVLDTAVSTRRAQVHQATGMVAAQLGVSMTDALVALRAYAYTRGRRLTDVAADVVERKVRLFPRSPSLPINPVPPIGVDPASSSDQEE